jgi:mannose-1-phosphate guanylyltransferase
MRVKEAMLLCAGLSTRLRPLTERTPKPLLPFWNGTVLDFMLEFLSDGGIESAAVNLHHGRGEFLEALKRPHKIPLTPFVEEPVILETGGGIKNMRSFVAEENFVVANCDFVCDIDLKGAVKFHLEKKALATMVLLPRPDEHKYKTIGVDGEGRIVTFPYGPVGEKPKAGGVFSGIHIFHRAIFDEMPGDPVFGINRDVYPGLLAKGAPVFGHVQKASWLDLGETRLYAEAQFALLKKHPAWVGRFLEKFTKTAKGVFIARNALVPPDARIKGPALISERVQVGGGARIGPNVVLGAGARIGEKCSLENAVVFPDLPVAPGSVLRHSIVTRAGVFPAV